MLGQDEQIIGKENVKKRAFSAELSFVQIFSSVSCFDSKMFLAPSLFSYNLGSGNGRTPVIKNC